MRLKQKVMPTQTKEVEMAKINKYNVIFTQSGRKIFVGEMWRDLQGEPPEWFTEQSEVTVREWTTPGQGYSGGHETAIRMGWKTTPGSHENAHVWVEFPNMGAFTGADPETLCFEFLPVPKH